MGEGGGIIQPNTPLEPSEWVNKMLTNVWPNFIEPKLVHKLVISVAVTHPTSLTHYGIIPQKSVDLPCIFSLRRDSWFHYLIEKKYMICLR